MNESHQGGPEEGNMEYRDLTETIIGCASRVYNKMKTIIMLILFILSKINEKKRKIFA